MSSILHFLTKRRASVADGIDFVTALESAAYDTPAYGSQDERDMMAYHHGEKAALAYSVPGLTANQRHALVCCVYNDTVIDIYQHGQGVGGDWVIELNHFKGTPGYCIPAYGQFLLTPERWQAVYLDLCPNAERAG